jgi:hypothetical protein
MLSRENADQHFGNISVSHEPFVVGLIPWGCTVYVDTEHSERCQIRFDANLYARKEMNALLDQYLRLLGIVADESDLPVGTLLTMAGARKLLWTYRRYTANLYDLLFSIYAASPRLKMFWRPIKRRLLPHA